MGGEFLRHDDGMKTKEIVDRVEAVLGKRTLFLTVTEFAQLVNRSRDVVWKECVRGELKAVQVTGKYGSWRIPVEELERYFQRG